MIPGSNLLKLAQRVQRKQKITLRKFKSSEPNEAGLLVSTYERDRTFKESVQAISRANYQSMGLDFDRVYIAVYASANVSELRRATSNDIIIFNGN